MTEVTVTLSDQQVDELLKHELKRDLAYLRQWKAERKRGEGFAYGYVEAEMDADALGELCSAFMMVMNYYGFESDLD